MPQALLSYAANLRRIDALGRAAPSAGVRHISAASTSSCASTSKHPFHEYKESTVLRRIQRRMQVLQLADIAAYVERLEADPRRAGSAVPRPADRRHALLPRPRGLRRAGAQGDAGAGRGQGCGRPDPGVGAGLRLGRGGLLDRHPAARAAAAAVEPAAAADLRDRHRRGGARGRAHGRLPGGGARRDVAAPNGSSASSCPRTASTASPRSCARLCIFSVHNVIADPPFSRLDLISCRNLLIYLAPQLQSRIVPLFHYALREDGFLFLGTAENRRPARPPVRAGRPQAAHLPRADRANRAAPDLPGRHLRAPRRRHCGASARPSRRRRNGPTASCSSVMRRPTWWSTSISMRSSSRPGSRRSSIRSMARRA